MSEEQKTSPGRRKRASSPAVPAAVESSPDSAAGTAFSLEAPAEILPRDDAATPAAPKARLSIALNADGTADLSSLRTDTKEKLKRVVADVGLRPALGLELAPDETPDVVGPEMVEPLYMLVGRLESAIAARVWKVPYDVAAKVFAFDKIELAMLTPATSKVLNKYGSGWLAKYGDEFSLALALLAVHQAKIASINQAAAMWREKQAQLAAQQKAEREATAKAAAAGFDPVAAADGGTAKEAA